MLPEQYPVTVSLNNLIQKYFSKEYKQRQEEDLKEKQMDKNNIPIFILDYVLYPGTTLALHIFEPRYRLMMRRCMSGSKSFGLVAYGAEGGIAKYGTIAKITNMQMLADGRSLVDTVGDKRFCILDTWEQDGYTCGRVEWVQEDQITAEEEKKKLKESSEKAFLVTSQILQNIGSNAKQAIEAKIGKMPNASQPVELSFWLAALLGLSVLSPQDRVLMLKETNTRARLEYLTPMAANAFNQYRSNVSCTIS
jgi:Lon protease-like protein